MTKYARKFEIASSHFVSKHKHLANPLYPLVCLRNLWTPPRLDTFLKIIALKFIKNNQVTVQFPESTKLYTYQIVYVFWDIFVIAQPNFEKIWYPYNSLCDISVKVWSISKSLKFNSFLFESNGTKIHVIKFQISYTA